MQIIIKMVIKQLVSHSRKCQNDAKKWSSYFCGYLFRRAFSVSCVKTTVAKRSPLTPLPRFYMAPLLVFFSADKCSIFIKPHMTQATRERERGAICPASLSNSRWKRRMYTSTGTGSRLDVSPHQHWAATTTAAPQHLNYNICCCPQVEAGGRKLLSGRGGRGVANRMHTVSSDQRRGRAFFFFFFF